MAILCYVSTRIEEKVVTRICQCMLKLMASYHSEQEAFSPLYAFQVQITKSFIVVVVWYTSVYRPAVQKQ